MSSLVAIHDGAKIYGPPEIAHRVMTCEQCREEKMCDHVVKFRDAYLWTCSMTCAGAAVVRLALETE